MSTIATFLTMTGNVYREEAISGEAYTQEEIIESGIRGVLQPVQDRTQLFNQDSWGKEYWWFCDFDVDIQPNDTLEVDGIKYGVIGRSKYRDDFENKDLFIKVVVEEK